MGLLISMKSLNPLLRLEEAERSGRIPSPILNRVRKRMKYVEEGVAKIELASGLKYPHYYVETVLPLSSSRVETGQIGIFYAMTRPTEGPSGLEILVQLSAPLVAFGLKTTIKAVLAHEFLHYMEIARRFNKLDVVSEALSTSLFESLYSDYGRLFEARLIFSDKRLVKLIKDRFSNGLSDKSLNEKTLKEWIEKGLPTVSLSPESNVIRVPISSIMNMRVDPLLKLKIEELEREGYERRQRRSS